MPRINIFLSSVAILALACLPGAAQLKLAYAQTPYVGPPISYEMNINLVQGDIILSCELPANIKDFSYAVLLLDNQMAGMAGNVQNIEFPIDTNKLTDGLHTARAFFVDTRGNKQYSGEFYFTPVNKESNQRVNSATTQTAPSILESLWERFWGSSL